VSWAKSSGFLGRDALLRQKEAGVSKRQVSFALESTDYLLYHNEPIWRDGVLVGRITSGMFGHTLGMGYVRSGNGPIDAGYVNAGRYEIGVAGERIPATASLKPFYDPSGQRVRA
jgi:4-methylaminobutanoate oxidase (formaldehyde-forming)